jgi:prepilin-type N-terminal cleavage/methylation domain-containing protein
MCLNLPRFCHRRGFTLIESALATVIVGVALVATFRLFAACTQQNATSTRMTTAMMLAENVHEAMIGLLFNDPGTGSTTFGPEPGETLARFDDVDDFNGPAAGPGMTFSPPIDSQRNALAGMGKFSQHVSVWPVYLNNLRTNSDPSAPDLPQTSYTGAVRIRVRVLHQSSPDDDPVELYRQSWIRVDN